uniref:Fucosyltransferase n=1 Tax=Panagrolaimus superbus TaxID=310955 RepID=A0A914YGS9_9BILA
MVMKDVMYSNTNLNRLNIYYSIEAFPHEKFRRKLFPKNFFNLSMSFRRDSTIWKPYDWFERIKPFEKNNPTLVWTSDDLNIALSKKTQLAVQFVSHCETHSLREKYVEKLERYANISTFGLCVNKTFESEKQELAFENAVCKDYVTEKFWRIKDLIVPVVIKRSLLKGIIENEYFIAADDFESPKDLANRLIYLSKNLNE